ncbi:hypothetical protein AVEN_113872-1, partial [Araneus ventricosus]
TPRASCLFNYPGENQFSDSKWPGQLMSLDEQCKRDGGTGACQSVRKFRLQFRLGRPLYKHLHPLYIITSHVCHLLPNDRRASYIICTSTSVHVRQRSPSARITSSLLLKWIAHSGSFILEKR